MNTFDKYLVVSEFAGRGYVIGHFSSLEQADKAKCGLVDKYQNSLLVEWNMLHEKEMSYPAYKVHPSCKYNLWPSKQNFSGGAYEIYILDTTLKGFTLKKLFFERQNTIYAFNIGEYDCNENRFATNFINLIAN